MRKKSGQSPRKLLVPLDMHESKKMRKITFLFACVFTLQLIYMQCLFAANVDHSEQKMIVLGVDGMDPELTMDFVTRGLMPNVKSLIDRGAFSAVETSFPPQSCSPP